jgi:hypothetical protein
MKHLILFLSALFFLDCVFAQKPCSEQNIHGTWKACGSVPSDSYERPPETINSDSLKNAFQQYNDSADSWSFTMDGTYIYSYTGGRIRKGRFAVVESNCALKVSFRKRNPIRIVYLDDSCMILWCNNPKRAYLTVYRTAE